MPEDTTADITENLAWLTEFAKRVRAFAAGHTRGGLGRLHQDAGEAIRRIDTLQAQLKPHQLALLPEVGCHSMTAW